MEYLFLHWNVIVRMQLAEGHKPSMTFYDNETSLATTYPGYFLSAGHCAGTSRHSFNPPSLRTDFLLQTEPELREVK